MAELYSYTIPNLIQGISQQPDGQRDPSQGEIQINAVSSITDGLRKRDNTRVLARLATAPFGDAFMHQILRDEVEKYLVVITKTAIRVFRLDGTEIPVIAPGGYGYLSSVVSCKSDIRAATIADYTFISNTKTKAAMQEDLAPATPRAWPNEALVWVKAANYGQTYIVTANGTTVSTTTEVAPVIVSGGVTTSYRISAADIAEALRAALAPTFNGIVTRVGAVLHLQSGLPITLGVADARSNADIAAITRSVQSFTELPAIAPDGYQVEIVGDPGNKQDGYYVQFAVQQGAGLFGAGSWEECVGPGVEYLVDPNTMPHLLARKADGNFFFGPATGGRLPLATPPGTFDPQNFVSCVGLADGRVFLVPFNSTTARIYDQATNSFSIPSGTYAGGGAFESGVLLADGRVLLVPFNSTTARIYDPTANTLSTPAGTYPGGGAFRGGVRLADGRVFLVPFNSTTARIYDPTTNTLSTPSGTYPGSEAQFQGVRLADGRVFMAGYGSVCRIFDPTAGAVVTAGPGAGVGTGRLFAGCVLLADGRVLLVPHNNTTARIYNPSTNTFSTPAGTYPGGGAFVGGVRFSDGRVFLVPYNATAARVFDPTANTLTTPSGTYPGKGGHDTAALLPDGSAFCCPQGAPAARIYSPALDPALGFTLPTWGNRTAGDYDTAPDPGFIGNAINDLFIHKNRLGLLSDEKVILSRAADFFQFFPETVTTTLDSDPIEISGSSQGVSVLRYAVPYQDELVLFADQIQYRFGSSEAVLTPETAQINQLTTYQVDRDVRPVQAGGAIIFGQPNGEWTQFREFTIRGAGTALVASGESITENVAAYVPGGVSRLEVNDTGNAWYAISSRAGFQNRIYAHKWFTRSSGGGAERVQASWSYWEFAGARKVLQMLCVEEVLYLLMEYADGTVWLEAMSVSDQVRDRESSTPMLLDRRISTTTATPAAWRVPAGVFNSVTNTTTWTLPFNVAATTEAWSAYGGAWVGGVKLGQITSGNTITAQGNWSAAAVWFGERYNMLYRLTRFKFVRDIGGGKLASNTKRVQIRRASLRFHRTGWFKATVTPKYRQAATYRYDGINLGQGLQEGVFTIPIMGKGEDVVVEISNDTPLPCQFLTCDWEGLVTGKSRGMQ